MDPDQEAIMVEGAMKDSLKILLHLIERIQEAGGEPGLTGVVEVKATSRELSKGAHHSESILDSHHIVMTGLLTDLGALTGVNRDTPHHPAEMRILGL